MKSRTDSFCYLGFFTKSNGLGLYVCNPLKCDSSDAVSDLDIVTSSKPILASVSCLSAVESYASKMFSFYLFVLSKSSLSC